MFRYCSLILLAASLTLVSLGCDKKPQKPRTEPPAETGAQEPQPDAEQPDAEQPDAGAADQDAQADTEDGEETDRGQAADCPKPRDYQGMCAQVITWARNPDTGTCCQYGSPCEAPQNWQTFTSEADCVQAGGQTEQ